MGFLALVGPWFMKYWKIILPVVLLMLALGYVQSLRWRIDYLNGRILVLSLAVKEGKEREEQLRTNAVALTAKYETRLLTKEEEIQAQRDKMTERILADEETKRIRLSANVVRLFNDSKPQAQPEPAANPKPTDAKGPSPDSPTLNALLYVSAVNDAAHELCRQTVKEWQSFWKDYVASYEKVGE